MGGKYERLQWVIQKNLTNQDDLQALVRSCKEIEVDCVEVEIMPFIDQLPTIGYNSKHTIFYGSTTLGELVKNNEKIKAGFFFNEAAFSIENYIKRWREHMLNFGASITTIRQLINEVHEPDKLLFVRPDNDSKSFSGEVIKFSEVKDWYNKLISSDSRMLTTDSKIIVSEPYNLRHEWRLWIVNKKVIASSKYREEFRLKKERGCPESVVKFAEDRCLEYTPHDIFVMDICQTGDEFYIIECGCMNSAGFYASDIGAIVENVTEYFLKTAM